MTILVTGANGQLGSELRLLASGSSHRFVFTDVAELDICNLEAVREAVAREAADVIVNCAAYTNVEAAEDNAELAERLNAEAPGNLAIAMKESGGLLVHISTDYIFGAATQAPSGSAAPGPCQPAGPEPETPALGTHPSAGPAGRDPIGAASSSIGFASVPIGAASSPIGEDAQPAPLGVYGLSKLHGEQAVMASGCRYIIIRTAWMFSEFGKNFVKTMLALTASKPAIKVVNDQRGTPTYALDLASVILQLLDFCCDSSVPASSQPGISSPASEPTERPCSQPLPPTWGSDPACSQPLPLVGGSDPACSQPSFPAGDPSDAPNGVVFNFTNEGECTWYEFASRIAELSGHTDCNIQPCLSSEFPSRVTRPAYSVLDKSRIIATLGITIPHWEDSLRACLEKLGTCATETRKG